MLSVLAAFQPVDGRTEPRTVRAGETLSSIARSILGARGHDMPPWSEVSNVIEDILRRNDGLRADPHYIAVGWTIDVPAPRDEIPRGTFRPEEPITALQLFEQAGDRFQLLSGRPDGLILEDTSTRRRYPCRVTETTLHVRIGGIPLTFYHAAPAEAGVSPPVAATDLLHGDLAWAIKSAERLRQTNERQYGRAFLKAWEHDRLRASYIFNPEIHRTVSKGRLPSLTSYKPSFAPLPPAFMAILKNVPKFLKKAR